jgi:predicted nucleotidyltransferase
MDKLSEKDLQKINRFLKDKARKKQEHRKRLFLAATHDFKNIVEMMIRKYHPFKIYQWGSLLNEEIFSESSDIDIAVEGLGSVEDFFALLGDAEELTVFPLDIVQIEKIHPLHAESIKKKGRLVYERT